MPILLPRPAFIAAVNERIAWLAENRTEEQLENFLSGLADARRRIEQSPEAGPPLKSFFAVPLSIIAASQNFSIVRPN